MRSTENIFYHVTEIIGDDKNLYNKIRPRRTYQDLKLTLHLLNSDNISFYFTLLEILTRVENSLRSLQVFDIATLST